MPKPRFEIRPLGAWIGRVTDPRRSGAQFRARWDDTVAHLLDEVERLDGGMVVLQVDAEASQIRRDGMLFARARVTFPGIKVAFDTRHGPLTYATDAYEDWRANVRAVALGLGALRAIDRYGIGSTGEQYRGWTAIPSKAAEHALTVDEAARVLADAAGISASTLDRSHQVLADGRSTSPMVDAQTVQESRAVIEAAYRKAAKASHPDHGGDPAVFRLVTAARDVLIGADRG